MSSRAGGAGSRTFMMVSSSEMRLLSARADDCILVSATVLVGASLLSLRPAGSGLVLEMAEFKYQSGLESSLRECVPDPFLIDMVTIDPGVSVPTRARMTVSAVTS